MGFIPVGDNSAHVGSWETSSPLRKSTCIVMGDNSPRPVVATRQRRLNTSIFNDEDVRLPAK
jgi:hypothetical protein